MMKNSHVNISGIVFTIGRVTCDSIAKWFQMLPIEDVDFPVTDNTIYEVSLAILGCSIACLLVPSRVMTKERGAKIDELCNKIIDKDDLPTHFTECINNWIAEYKVSCQKAMDRKEHPFGNPSGIMLCSCLGQKLLI